MGSIDIVEPISRKKRPFLRLVSANSSHPASGHTCVPVVSMIRKAMSAVVPETPERVPLYGTVAARAGPATEQQTMQEMARKYSFNSLPPWTRLFESPIDHAVLLLIFLDLSKLAWGHLALHSMHCRSCSLVSLHPATIEIGE